MGFPALHQKVDSDREREMTKPDKLVNMDDFDNAHAFVDGFFAALATRAPQSASLKSSYDVVESCLRLGQSISQEQNPNRAANITLASVALAASIINQINASNG